ncbi:hypothetical protein F5883DRAFT_571329 [Diaporthe sp. PMI_573]|jgi:hypothetical protein|nr:hypothetical protein F5883DRAFT_571329 [Diaporthaceae sp. PMI_573]
MKSIFPNILLFPAMTVTGIAIDVISTAVVSTVTEPVCINGCAREATPLPESEALATVIASTVENDDANGTEATVDRRWSKGRNSLCFTSSSLVLGGGYAIYLDGWGQEHDGCGKGALDNLRGQCGDVWYWTCQNWGSGVLLTFYLAGPPRAKCAVDAMWLASPKDQREEGLCCVYLGSQIGSMNTC